MPEIRLSPFYSDITDYETKAVKVESGMNVGDILAELADTLGIEKRHLALIAKKTSTAVRLHPKELPLPWMQLKGVDSLDEIPDGLEIKARGRQGVTLQEGLQIQDELIEAYTEEYFIQMMMNVRAECRKKWANEEEMNTKDYNTKMRPLLELAQEKVLPRWGYEPGVKGMMLMQNHFSPIDPLPEVAEKVDQINRTLGFDFVWIGEDDELENGLPSRNYGAGGKMKMLFLYGGCVNKTVGKMQINNMFKDSTMWKNMEFQVWEAPHASTINWHGVGSPMQQQLAPFGDKTYMYFERVPATNLPNESWTGIDKTMKDFKDFLKQKGPFDGVVGFDMGGELLLQAATLAQEGDAGLKDKWRFMILFTTGTARHNTICKRPKTPLTVPAIISFARSDENHPFTVYEETASFFDKAAREVVIHDQGHLPPRIKAGDDLIERFDHLLEAMFTGDTWVPMDSAENKIYKDLSLPVKNRTVESVKPMQSGVRHVIVVTDPMGQHDYADVLPGQEDYVKQLKPKPAVPFKSCGGHDIAADTKMRMQCCKLTHEDFKKLLGDSFSVETAEYTDAQKSYQWHLAASDLPSQISRPEDYILDEKHEAEVQRWADGIVKTLKIGSSDMVSIVGIGTGGYIATNVAKKLLATTKLSGVWYVNPPTRTPNSSLVMGALQTVPVHVLVHDGTIAGPQYIYETSTTGPYTFEMFKKVDEMMSMICDGIKEEMPHADDFKEPVRVPPKYKDVPQKNLEYMEVQELSKKNLPGDYYGIRFPHSKAQILEMGPEWLTKAFHTAGTMQKNNAVTKIKSAREFVGGGAGLKCIVELEYKHDADYLHKELFIKLPHKGGSDRYYVSCMWNHDRPEMVFYIWLEKCVPFRVPKFYFGDICAETTNYILICEKIPYADSKKKSFKPGEIEPPYDKHKDWELPSPPGAHAYYISCLRALGRMAGMYKSKQLSPDVDMMFPFPLMPPTMPLDMPRADDDSYKVYSAKVDSLVKFVGTTAKAVYPPEVVDATWLARVKEEMLHINDYMNEINIYQGMDPDYVALIHNNVQIDNAFFWKNADGELEVGLLDWGILATAPVAGAVYGGCISGAQPEVFKEHLDTFLTEFIEAYAINGGPKLDKDRLKKQVYLAMVADLASLPSNVAQVLKNTKAAEWAEIKDWMDPKLVDRFQTRVHSARFKNCLQLYKALDLYPKFTAWLAEMGLPKSKR